MEGVGCIGKSTVLLWMHLESLLAFFWISSIIILVVYTFRNDKRLMVIPPSAVGFPGVVPEQSQYVSHLVSHYQKTGAILLWWFERSLESCPNYTGAFSEGIPTKQSSWWRDAQLKEVT
jgi:hypothetical protein